MPEERIILGQLRKTTEEDHLEKNQDRDILDKFQEFLEGENFENRFKYKNNGKGRINSNFTKVTSYISLLLGDEGNAGIEEEKIEKELYEMAIIAISNKIFVSNYSHTTQKDETIIENFQKLVDKITGNKLDDEKYEANLEIWSKIAKESKPISDRFLNKIILSNLEENMEKLNFSFSKKINFYEELASKTKDYNYITDFVKNKIRINESLNQEKKRSLLKELEEKKLNRKKGLKNKSQINSVSNQQTQEITTICNESSNRNELFTNVDQSLSATKSRKSEKRNSPAVRRSTSVENKDSSPKNSQNPPDNEIENEPRNIFPFRNLQNSLYIETESESKSSSDTTYSDEDKKSLVKSQVGFFNSSTEGLQNDLPLPAICLTNINSINTQQLNATTNKESRKRDSSVVSESNFIESEDLFLEDSQNSLYIETESESESSFSGIYSLKDDDDYTDNRELPPNTGNKRRNQGRGSGSLF